MPTTSLKLSEELKQQAAAAARREGLTPHAFMVQAIKTATAAAENRACFIEEAHLARKAMRKSGQGFDGSEVHAHMRARLEGRTGPELKAKPWRA